MFQRPAALSLGFIVLIFASEGSGQTPAPPANQPTATPGLIKLTGADAKRAEELDKAIAASLTADRWDEAIAKAEELLALRAKVQGLKHFETMDAEWRLKTLRRVAPMSKEDRVAYESASTMNKQAAAFFREGKFAAAQPLLERALEIRRRLLTDEDPETAEGYSNLAVAHFYQRKYAQAQTLNEKALSILRRLFTGDHPDMSLLYNNLASSLSYQGKFAQAQPMFENALEIRRRLLSDEHPLTVGTYQSLAQTLDAQGKHAQAQPLFEKILQINRRVRTDDHPDTALSYDALARSLLNQGKYAQAQPLFEKAFEIRHRLLLDDHPATAESYNNMAANLRASGKFAQAQPLFEKALEIKRRLLTDNHPDTAMGYHNLAANLASQGKHAEAQPLVEKALEIQRRLTGDDHLTARFTSHLAANLSQQGKFAQAQPLYEKALEIERRLLTDENPSTAESYQYLAQNLRSLGKCAEAQPILEKALEIRRRLLGDDHPDTAANYNSLAANLAALGEYGKAKDLLLAAAKSDDATRLRVAFTGLERVETGGSIRPGLAAVLARLGQPAEAWRSLEEDLGRGLLDELAARQDRRLAPAERDRLRELTAALERLDKLVETTPRGLDEAARARRFEDLKRQRDLASIALGEFHTKLVDEYGALAGQVATLSVIQSALAADAAFVTWVDIAPVGPNPADPDGEHWGVVVRSRGIPAWIAIAGTGPNGLWTKDDDKLAGRARAGLRIRPGAGSAELRPLVEKLRTQRLEPLAKALGATADGLPPARRLIVLPSRAMVGIPIEAMLADDDSRTVSYAPSATVFRYLREQPRPDRHAGFLALGDPIFEQSDRSSLPSPLPDHGLLVNVVMPGSNASTHGLKAGDVLLAYNGTVLHKREDLRAVPEPGQPVPVEIWRAGEVAKRELAPGKLGVVLDTRPASVAIAEQRKLQQVLVAARSGDDDFAHLPGTRYEVEGLARLFKSDDRPTRTLVGVDASESELDRLAASGDLGRYGFIHLATHGVIDEDLPTRSAVILTQTGLPDPLQQALSNKPVFDGRLSVREIQRSWDLHAELVTLSACETALGRSSGGEGFVGFSQALLMSGARSICLSLWKVDDTATALLMQRFYANLLGRRAGLSQPMPKALALAEAKAWLRGLTRDEAATLAASSSGGEARSKGAAKRKEADSALNVTPGRGSDHPYAHPYYWAAFVLVGDPD
jgi:tetratricopeptide (TPR) repeat protein